MLRNYLLVANSLEYCSKLKMHWQLVSAATDLSAVDCVTKQDLIRWVFFILWYRSGGVQICKIQRWRDIYSVNKCLSVSYDYLVHTRQKYIFFGVFRGSVGKWSQLKCDNAVHHVCNQELIEKKISLLLHCSLITNQQDPLQQLTVFTVTTVFHRCPLMMKHKVLCSDLKSPPLVFMENFLKPWKSAVPFKFI